MAADFDPEDKNSWYFGPLSRGETNDMLMSERDSGVFLVRDSKSIKGDFVLCVREDNKVSHYIINKIQVSGAIRYRIGDQEFPDLPSLLNFYKTHYLDTTSLIRPGPRERFIAKFDFTGKDPEDLPFKKGEILTILQKDEEQWWTAKKDADSTTGLIPVPYIQKYDPELERRLQEQTLQSQTPAGALPGDSNNIIKPPASAQNGQQRKLPARARVIQQRIPNAYDKTALRLEVGDEILVTSMNINGQWEGEIAGRNGHFPFTHVKFIDPDCPDEDPE